MNSPKAFRAERLSWRAVVQLNVVRSIRLVLDAIADQADAQGLSLTPRSSTSSRSDGQPQILTQSQAASLQASQMSNGNHNGASKGLSNEDYALIDELMNDPDLITYDHLQLRRRLLPLLDAEAVLLARLMPVAAASGASLREIENSHATNGVSGSQGTSNPNGGERSLEEAVCEYRHLTLTVSGCLQ